MEDVPLIIAYSYTYNLFCYDLLVLFVWSSLYPLWSSYSVLKEYWPLFLVLSSCLLHLLYVVFVFVFLVWFTFCLLWNNKLFLKPHTILQMWFDFVLHSIQHAVCRMQAIAQSVECNRYPDGVVVSGKISACNYATDKSSSDTTVYATTVYATTMKVSHVTRFHLCHNKVNCMVAYELTSTARAVWSTYGTLQGMHNMQLWKLPYIKTCL